MFTLPIIIVKSIVYWPRTILYCARIKSLSLLMFTSKLFRLLSLFVQTCTYERNFQEKEFDLCFKTQPNIVKLLNIIIRPALVARIM